MLVIGLLLAGAVAWLLERISQVPKNPHQRGDLLKRAQVLAVAAVIAAVGLGITLAKTPVVGQAIDQGATSAAGFLSGVYDPTDPSGWSVPVKPDVPAQPVEPGGLPSWVMASLGLLVAVLALAGGLAVLAARRAGRRARVGHAA